MYITQTERSLAFRSAAPAAAVHAAARHQRPLRPLPMAETGLWGPCVLLTHVRAPAASTVDADIMLSMTSAVARHCISPRCCWYTPAGLGHTACRSPHSGDVYQQHRSACSAHGTTTVDSSSLRSGTRGWHARHRSSLVLSRPRSSSPIYTRPGQAAWPLRSAIPGLTVTVQ